MSNTTDPTLTGLKRLRRFYERHGLSRQAGARDKEGRPVDVHSPLAVSFCLPGAFYRLWPDRDTAESSAASQALIREAGQPLAYWTQYVGRHRGDVLRLIDRAIARIRN